MSESIGLSSFYSICEKREKRQEICINVSVYPLYITHCFCYDTLSRLAMNEGEDEVNIDIRTNDRYQ